MPTIFRNMHSALINSIKVLRLPFLTLLGALARLLLGHHCRTICAGHLVHDIWRSTNDSYFRRLKVWFADDSKFNIVAAFGFRKHLYYLFWFTPGLNGGLMSVCSVVRVVLPALYQKSSRFSLLLRLFWERAARPFALHLLLLRDV